MYWPTARERARFFFRRRRLLVVGFWAYLVLLTIAVFLSL
jgi:hypothetical protein